MKSNFLEDLTIIFYVDYFNILDSIFSMPTIVIYVAFFLV